MDVPFPLFVSWPVERADKALERDLCDHCLGRLFAQLESGHTNLQRGQNLRAGVNLLRSLSEEEPPVHRECWVCGGIFDQVDRFASAAARRLSEVESDNFLLGTRIDPHLSEREERMWGEVGGESAESIKGELNREIGKRVEHLTGKGVEFDNPQVVAVVDTRFAHVELDIAPLFLYGRYRKLSREIPQTKWPCRKCGGKGCDRCDHTGKQYPTSVQELIGDPLLEMTGGEDHFFHGMGREDIDALMLGSGRPFVIEVRNPRIRRLDLERAEGRINLSENVEVTGLRPSSREEVRRVKMSTPPKTYRIGVLLNGKVHKDKVNEVVRSLKNTTIIQQTPQRVAHRRADKARRRRIVDARLESLEDHHMALILKAESGTYVKEFVHGDQGRTKPNLSEALGVPCEVVSLDVIEIADSEG